MQITKVKFTGERVDIEYQKQGAKADLQDKFRISCTEQPRPSLNTVLQSLRDFVVKTCEFPQEQVNTVTVLSVTFGFKGEKEIMGAVVTAAKRVKAAPSPVIIDTPFLPEKPLGTGKKLILPADVAAILHELMEEAEAYIDGERAQVGMFKGDEHKA
jgi:hypothetical protein